jgi:lipopolysaccharide transport system ATP-binding protein
MSSSDNIAIRVSHVSKQYILGGPQEPYHTFRDAIINSLKTPLKIFHKELPLEGFWALKDISFDVERGEVVGIIGRNGAGKSTLLKILSRITSPTEGTVELHGRVGSLLEVGTGFHPELTGRENIYLSGSILGMKRREIDSKLDDIVKFSEIEQFLDTPVKRYSSGMYIRLAFAVAAHLEPEILLVDEVLAVGDSAFQKKCLGKMDDVAKEGKTVLFVSHNITAIKNLCNKAILLQKGKIEMNDSAEAVTSRYLASMQENRLIKKWDDQKFAPQNTCVVLNEVSVRNKDGQLMDAIYTDTPFYIQIQYQIICDNGSAGLSVAFYDNENNCVFISMNNQELNYYDKSMAKGNYCSICKIPANLFNNGIFNVDINIFGKNFSDNCDNKDILRFEILDGSTVRKDYYGDYKGVLRPLLHWVTRKREI